MTERKCIAVEARHRRFLKGSNVSLSPLVRDRLDQCIASDELGQLPKRSTRRTGPDFVSTTIIVAERHSDIIAAHDINLSAFVGEVVEEKMGQMEVAVS